MDQNQAKKAAAEAALKYLVPGEVLGVGTGSTVNFFIDALAPFRHDIPGAVSSSEASTARLKAVGIPVLDANAAGPLSIYVDGADEADRHLRLIKGGGAALTREKIVAEAARTFVCIVDESKLVPVLGKFPLPVEVIPMAATQLARRFQRIGGQPTLRDGVVTDNGCHILDVRGLQITDPLASEIEINQWPGVVTVGIFARHRASVCLLGTSEGVKTMRFAHNVPAVRDTAYPPV